MGRSNPPAVHISKRFSASPEVVFDAWFDPDLIERWMFVSPMSEIVKVTMDVCVGGRFSILERSDDGEIDHFGQYLELIRPRRLAFSLQVPRHFPGVTIVMVDVIPVMEGCEIALTQTGVAREVTEGSWQMMLRQLSRVLESKDEVSEFH